jgi:chromosome segregation ATPase
MNTDSLLKNAKELKEQLHRSRKNNGVLRSKVSKLEKEANDLRNNKLMLVNNIEKLEQARERDIEYIKKQEKEIQNLNEQLRKTHSKNHSGHDPEKEQLKTTLEAVVEVKLKYENIIRALVDNPEVKPFIARILEQN